METGTLVMGVGRLTSCPSSLGLKVVPGTWECLFYNLTEGFQETSLLKSDKSWTKSDKLVTLDLRVNFSSSSQTHRDSCPSVPLLLVSWKWQTLLCGSWSILAVETAGQLSVFQPVVHRQSPCETGKCGCQEQRHLNRPEPCGEARVEVTTKSREDLVLPYSPYGIILTSHTLQNWEGAL